MFLGGVLLLSGETLLTQKSLERKTIRLHVIANSDSVEDQEQKLRLRDRVLEKVHAITMDCTNFDEAERALLMNLEELETYAHGVMLEEGSSYDVSISLCREHYSTRNYDTFSLPPGNYRSLKVIIGEGKGKNWWCVVFPTLCNASSMDDFQQAATIAGYDQEDIALIQKETPKYKIRFKVLEMITELFH